MLVVDFTLQCEEILFKLKLRIKHKDFTQWYAGIMMRIHLINSLLILTPHVEIKRKAKN